ncbi:tRNA pseudouridine(38-40) synthase TruA [Anaerobacillus sp. CMMVII]|uniref:tRNA pseudouridine(38-40) synthase TruA n=1 Tax=Anaerobacillus sp. CMMVII TaxID=2755588 RepID=UPI0021B7000E|nr:tRNA pseudouridine(38-40) synthase TruA [Anaerobacillus sp. CMMVII]MCT8136870.1 tRNA pseudouridine(38-40) synthase TruA [Anaerobacillus sp. CMMVII]
MNNYKLLIQYDGGRYKGWQRLGGNENTIQGKIEAVITEMVGKETEIIGCSRTDAGVHALAQVANFKSSVKLTPEEVKSYLNKYLPQDISVADVSLVPERFHARYNAKDKTYMYKIWNEDYLNPFMRKHSMHIEKKLDVNRMKKAGQYFLGEHDFTAFSNAKSKKKTMVREIYAVDLEQVGGFIEIRICGNGFLYNMVRKMVGVLIEAGQGKIEPETVATILASKERNQLNFMADPSGLYLEKIEY